MSQSKWPLQTPLQMPEAAATAGEKSALVLTNERLFAESCARIGCDATPNEISRPIGTRLAVSDAATRSAVLTVLSAFMSRNGVRSSVPPLSYWTSISQFSPFGATVPAAARDELLIVGLVDVNEYRLCVLMKPPSPTTRSPAGSWSFHPFLAVRSTGLFDVTRTRHVPIAQPTKDRSVSVCVTRSASLIVTFSSRIP